jgi:hypothetical protein
MVKYFRTKQKISSEQMISVIDTFYKKKIDPVVKKTIQQLGYRCNAFDPGVQGADREVIGKALFVAKKKYTMLVYDNEGVRYHFDSPYIKTQGLQLVAGGTPEFSKKYLKKAVPVLMNSTKQQIIQWFDTVKQDFMNWNLEDIAKTQGVSKIYDPDWGTMKNGRKISIPFGSRVAVVSNTYIQQHNLQNRFDLIKPGDKIKILFLHLPNPLKSEAFGFSDPRFAELFKDYIDYDLTFQKYFMKPLEIMTEAIGINLQQNAESLDDW